MKKRKKKTQKKDTSTLKGIIEVTRSGVAYVIIPNQKDDVLVRPQHFNTALHGDTVQIEIIKELSKTGKKEGKVVEVLQRKQTEFIGRMQVSDKHAYFIQDAKKTMPDFFIPLDKLNGAKDKDMAVVRMTKWIKEDRNPVGEVVSILKLDEAGDRAMKEILTEAGFPIIFEKEIIKETEKIKDGVNATEISKRKDCRNILTFTIDPIDAKDFDDALSIQKISDDLYEIGVHIADVSHYIQENTLLDKAAYERATSVYLPDRVAPMLPERISNELCSLRPKEDKLTFSAMFHMNTQSEIKKYWLGKTVIHSNHRFTYEEVQEIIEKKEGLYLEEIMLFNTMAQTLRQKRFSVGAINFS